MRLPRRVLASVLVLELAVALIAAITIADLSAHAREEQDRGLNMWGFRGPVRLHAAARRLAVVGGSAAFGHGVEWDRSMPFYLGVGLGRERPPVNVVNLAATGDGAASYKATLERYAYLKPDAVCIYDGYAGVGTTSGGSTRHSSVLFRSIGYFPIVDDLVRGARPWDDAARASVDPLLRDDGGTPDVSCAGASRTLCAAIAETISWALARHLAVAVVTPPYLSRRHEAQQQSLVTTLAERFRGETHVRFIDMGRSIDLHNRAQSIDGVHPTPAGNQVIGENLVDPIFQLMQTR